MFLVVVTLQPLVHDGAHGVDAVKGLPCVLVAEEVEFRLREDVAKHEVESVLFGVVEGISAKLSLAGVGVGDGHAVETIY